MKKTIMLYLQATLSREGTKNSLKEDEHTVESHNKKSNQNKGFKWKPGQRKMYNTKREYKGKGHTDMSKIKCYNCGEYGHYACDCPKPCDKKKCFDITIALTVNCLDQANLCYLCYIAHTCLSENEPCVLPDYSVLSSRHPSALGRVTSY